MKAPSLNNPGSTNSMDSKSDIVRKALEQSIRDGKFVPGTRLPSERDIAKSLNVSTMTVNRAITQMVEEQWLERRPRVGTYVHSGAWQKISSKLLNLIAPLYDSPLIRQFYKAGKEFAQAKGFTANEMRIGRNIEEVTNAIRSGSHSLVFAVDVHRGNPIAEAMSDAAGRSVLIAGRLDDMNVHSVMGDDRHMIRMGMKYLQDRGHRKIGLVCCRRDNHVERERIAAWHACQSTNTRDADLQNRLIILDLPRGEHPVDFAYGAFRKAISTGSFDATSLICPDDETAIGLLSACRDEGISVPDDMSIISIGNTSYASHITPRLTSLDPNLRSQIELAIDLATSETKSEFAPAGLLHAVEPQLIERDSVATLQV